MINTILEDLAGWLGHQIGGAAGIVIQLVVYLLLVFLVWGLWWDRILTKAGFEGKPFWYLFGFMVAPVGLAPLIEMMFGPSASFTEAFAVMAALCMYGSLIAIALMPWPSRKPKAPKINLEP